MRRTTRWTAVLGLALAAVLSGSGSEAKAQGIAVGEYYPPQRGYGDHHRHHHGCGHHGWGGVSAWPGVGGYGGPVGSAVQRGYVEGRVYQATGRLPHHVMTPAELQGFLAGERRSVYVRPW